MAFKLDKIYYTFDRNNLSFNNLRENKKSFDEMIVSHKARPTYMGRDGLEYRVDGITYYEKDTFDNKDDALLRLKECVIGVTNALNKLIET